MIKTHIKFILGLCLFTSVSAFAQTNQVGVSGGYGASDIDENPKVFLLPYNKNDSRLHFFTVGLSYHYTPKNALFSLNTGLNYINRWDDVLSFNYIRIPLGLDFQFGNDVQFILGCGLYGSYLMSYSGVSSGHFENSKELFQLGAYLNTGIGIQLTEKYNLSLLYQTSFDVTELYTVPQPSHSGTTDEIGYGGYDGFIMLRLKYRLGKE